MPVNYALDLMTARKIQEIEDKNYREKQELLKQENEKLIRNLEEQ